MPVSYDSSIVTVALGDLDLERSWIAHQAVDGLADDRVRAGRQGDPEAARRIGDDGGDVHTRRIPDQDRGAGHRPWRAGRIARALDGTSRAGLCDTADPACRGRDWRLPGTARSEQDRHSNEHHPRATTHAPPTLGAVRAFRAHDTILP